MTELPVLSLASLGVDSLPLSGESDPNLPTIRNFDPPKQSNNQNVNNSPQHDVDEYIAPGTSASIYPSRTTAMPLTGFSSMDSNLPPSPPSSSRTLNIESQHTYNNNNEYRTTYAPIQADMHIQSASPSTFAHKAVDSHRELTQSQSESPLLHSNRTSTSHHASSLYPKHNIHIDNKKQFYKAHIFRRPNIPVSLPPRRYYDYRDGSNTSHPPSYDSKPNSSEGQCTCFAVTYTCSQCKQSIARTSLNNNNSLPVNPPQSSSPAHSPSPSTTPSTPNDAPCCCDSKSPPPTYPAVISLPELEAEVQSRYGLSEDAESAALEANQRALEKFALQSAEAAALPRLRTCSGQSIYTWSEVRRHASAESCWLVVRGVVYDVTPMLATHPAGIQSILRHAGTDASQHYDFHSPKAHQLWKKYEIGVIKGYKKPLCSIQ